MPDWTPFGTILNASAICGVTSLASLDAVLDIDDATDELNARWTNKKLLVHEEDIVSAIPSVPIGRDSLLRENPVCCPVRSFKGEWETPAIMVTVAIPVSAAALPKIVEESEKAEEPETGP